MTRTVPGRTLRDINQRAMDRQAKAAGIDAAVLVKALVAGRGDWQTARAIAQQWGSAGECSPRVLSALRAKAAVGTTSDPRDDSDLTDISSAFLGSLVHSSAFDGMLASMNRVPLPARYGSVTAGATAFIVDRGAAKPITSFSVTSDSLPVLKSVGIVTLSREAARLSGPPAGLVNGIVQRELTTAVSAVTDDQFVAVLRAAANTISASGIDARSVRRDVSAALSTIRTSSSSQLFVLMRSSTAKALCAQFTADGAGAFPEMGPVGGRLLGMPVLVTDALPSGDVLIVDASQIAAASEAVEFRTATDASLQFSSTPDSPATAATNMVSLWQAGLVAIAAERFWGCAVMGADAACVITSTAWGDSPAP